jgi:hypothetical protein
VLEVTVMELRPAGATAAASGPGMSTDTIVTLTAMLGDGSSYKSVSTYHSQPVSSGTGAAVEWNEQAILGGLKGDNKGALLVTAVRKSETGAVQVVGQGLMHIRNYPLLHTYQPIDVALKLLPYAHRIKDSHERPVYNNIITKKLAEEELAKPAAAVDCGTMLLSVALCPFAYGMCGYMYRLSHELLSSKWKRRWFVLCDMVLYYYDDPDDVGTLKGSLDLGTVTSIVQGAPRAKDEVHYELIGKTTDGDAANWAIRFLEDDPRATQEMWKRKISRSCHYITGTNAFPVDEGVRPPLGDKQSSMLGSISTAPGGRASEVRSVNAVRRMSHGPGNSSGSFNKGGVRQKRSSIFGR